MAGFELSYFLQHLQLAEFRPVNFATMEERARHMEAAGIIVPQTAPEAMAMAI